MKYAACEWYLPVAGVEACLAAHRAGLDGIELNYRSVDTPEKREKIQRILKETGLELCAIAMNLPGDCSITNGLTDRVREVYAGAVTAMREMNVQVLQVPSFPPNEIDSDEKTERAAEVLRYVCDKACDRFIAGENTLSAEGAKKLMERTGRGNCGVYFDNENALYFGAGVPEDMLRELKGHIIQIHLKDGTDKEMSVMPLGQGTAHFAECVRAIKDIDYDDWIVLENDYKGNDGCAMLALDIATAKAAF